MGIVGLDWFAILVLVVARAQGGNIMSFGPTEDTIFAVGLLAIAVHSGFRLGQLEKMRAVERALSELDARSGHGNDSEEAG